VYLNAKTMPFYKDNQVVGRDLRKLDRNLGGVIIPLKPPITEGRGKRRVHEFGQMFGSGDRAH
jgi:hypothetical protein